MTRTEAKEIARTLRRYAGHEAMMEAYANGADLLFMGDPVFGSPAFDKNGAAKYTIAPPPKVKKTMQVKGWVRTSREPDAVWGLGDVRNTPPHEDSAQYWTEFTTEVEYYA